MAEADKPRFGHRLGRLPEFRRPFSDRQLFLLQAKRLRGYRFFHSIGQVGTGRAYIRVMGEVISHFRYGFATGNANTGFHSIALSTTITQTARGYYEPLPEGHGPGLVARLAGGRATHRPAQQCLPPEPEGLH